MLAALGGQNMLRRAPIRRRPVNGISVLVTHVPLSLSYYLARQFAQAFVWMLGLISGLILLFDMIELLRKSAAAGSTDLINVIALALMKLPHTLHDTLPFVALAATIFALFRLSRHHELVVMRAVGVSVWQMIAPTVATVALIGAINLTIVNPIAAELYDHYTRLSRQIVDPRAPAFDVGRSGFWLREATDAGAVIVHAASVNQDEGTLRLTGVLLLMSDAEDRLARRIEAKSGELSAGAFRLTEAHDMVPGEPVQAMAEYLQPTTITLTQIQENFARPDTLSLWTLPGFIAFSRTAGFSALSHRLYFQSLLASPVMLCVMVLVGSAFFLTAIARAGVWFSRALGGIGAGFLLYFVARFAYALGLAATLPISLAAWAPIVASALLAVSYLLYREDG